MKYLFSIIVLAVSMLHCTPNEAVKQEIEAGPPPLPDAAISYIGCYEMIIGKDTALMTLNDSAGSFVGPLNYKRFEKDSNKGMVTIKRENDLLTGWYRFNSEGVTTLKQIIFKTAGGKLQEGYGDVGMLGDSVYFKYPEALRFEEDHPFTKVNCK